MGARGVLLGAQDTFLGLKASHRHLKLAP